MEKCKFNILELNYVNKMIKEAEEEARKKLEEINKKNNMHLIIIKEGIFIQDKERPKYYTLMTEREFNSNITIIINYMDSANNLAWKKNELEKKLKEECEMKKL